MISTENRAKAYYTFRRNGGFLIIVAFLIQPNWLLRSFFLSNCIFFFMPTTGKEAVTWIVLIRYNTSTLTDTSTHSRIEVSLHLCTFIQGNMNFSGFRWGLPVLHFAVIFCALHDSHYTHQSLSQTEKNNWFLFFFYFLSSLINFFSVWTSL